MIIVRVPGVESDSLAEIQRSSVLPTATQLSGRRVAGAPVYAYVRTPGAPPISVLRFSADRLSVAHETPDHAHAHDFLVLAYFEHGGGSLVLGDHHWPLHTGDAFVIAPGEVVRLGQHDQHPAAGWCVFFEPELIVSGTLGGSLGWQSHPLLFPFLGGAATDTQRLPVPPGDRDAWCQHVTAIEHELEHPRDGSSEAALAYLTLLLVGAARITVDIGSDLRIRSEPQLAAVFEFIEQHYREPISLASVADAVGLTPGHLTTVVRRKTGRTVQRWITERRMADARRLLRETDLTIEAVAGAVGYRHTSHFIKHFRRDHTLTPANWRRQTRPINRVLGASPDPQ